jgi:hypothetical protein
MVQIDPKNQSRNHAASKGITPAMVCTKSKTRLF